VLKRYTQVMFDSVDPKQSFPDLERGILSYWRDEDMFRRSISLRDGREEFSFYDGPPFATGLPHYGHLLAGTIKDVIPRYQTMRGKKVQRRFGWDCHGLPIENLIEKEHEIKSKQEIEAMGVRRFNELCRSSVQRYAKEWRSTVERAGRWVDMDWDYKTMDPTFMESIWWVFKSLHDKGLIYEGRKPMHICPRCATPLSNFEVTQGYKDRTDMSVIMTFPLVDDPSTVLLAWTTTPWSLPGNFWLAVGPGIAYAKVKEKGTDTTFVLSQKLVDKVFKGKEFEIVGTVTAEELAGKHYTPLFPYFVDTVLPSTAAKNPQTYGQRVFKVVINEAVAVSEDEGTGIVHLTSATGEDSQAVATSEKVDIFPHIRIDGSFVKEVTDFADLNAKPEGEDPMSTDKKVIAYLKEHGRHFSSYTITHSYPHCWRCDTPLLPYSTTSWFVSVEKVKRDMLDANAKTEWVPAHLRDGRFGNWLENARDWAISRNRYWGTPLPIWRSKVGNEMDVIASREELMNRNKMRFTRVSAVRHGEAEHNVQGFYQSAIPGLALTQRGQEQAQKAGAYLAQQNVDVIYCSPLQRTMQTAQAIADATGARIIVDERLRESECGEYEGKAFDFDNLALMKLRRQKKMQENSPDGIYHLEGMEPWTNVYKRVDEFMKEMIPRHRSEHVIVVTHGDPLRCINHFFTREDPFKLSHQQMAAYATPVSYFWDHNEEAAMDLHKENVDEICWPSSESEDAVNVVLVRHGETDLNKKGIMQGGNLDEPLNDTGRKQAHDLAQKLKKETFDAIICSDLSRAAETAQILADELGMNITESLELLRERDMGTWSGKSEEEIVAAHPLVDSGIDQAFHHETPDNGESLSAFMTRGQKAYEAILKAYAGKKVLVVCHHGMAQALMAVAENRGYVEAGSDQLENGESRPITFSPLMKRIPEVLDCWFESGSMPYAQQHFPFEMAHSATGSWGDTPSSSGRAAVGESSSDAHMAHAMNTLPPGFPAEFIAEGIDQTRGWFYTLTVLSAALYKDPAFKHCVVNGIVLAEDGRKMSKRLKNYPEPTEVIEKYGADALRFTLMRSPAVRGEDLRFTEKAVEETLRSVLLPLWNSYSFFVTYANLAQFEPSAKHSASGHPLDRWIKAEVQDLVNRMTTQLDAYDLSATCDELLETIDALTNWYIRLSRRRFAGKGAADALEAEPENFEQDRTDALNTLYDVMLTVSQLLAPFCPFVTDQIYLNLVNEPNGSIHLTDWPESKDLTKEELSLIQTNRLLRRVVSLGLKIRSDRKVKVRTPLSAATVALPASFAHMSFNEDDMALLRQELNVKEIRFTADASELGEAYAQVDARKAGPRLGKRVQEVIQAGKRGEFEQLEDGRVVILDETLSPEEAPILYRGREGEDIATEKGVVVSIDMHVSEELRLEGLARDLIRAIQKLRKEQGYDMGEKVVVGIDEKAGAVLAVHKDLIEAETSVTIGSSGAESHTVLVGDEEMSISMPSKA